MIKGIFIFVEVKNFFFGFLVVVVRKYGNSISVISGFVIIFF